MFRAASFGGQFALLVARHLFFLFFVIIVLLYLANKICSVLFLSVVDTLNILYFVLSLYYIRVVLDRSLSFDQHVAAVCKNCHFHIRALRQVRTSLPEDVAKTVACSIIQSRLDYCNALFTGMSESNFKKLQRVQNTLARVMLRRGKYEHITPALAKLHWLPIQQRVTKIATTIFKIRYLRQPT